MPTAEGLIQQYEAANISGLPGKSIRAVRPLSRLELASLGWDPDEHVTGLELDDDTVIVAGTDFDYDRPGFFFAVIIGEKPIQVIAALPDQP